MAPTIQDVLVRRGSNGRYPSIQNLLEFRANGCWHWLGNIDTYGYGRITFDGYRWRPHRLIWTALIGEIPVGLVVDHMCRNTACCNPGHLRLVTPAQNVLENSSGFAASNARKTHCPRGPPYSNENTYRDKKGRRTCKECSKAAYRRWYRRTGRPNRRGSP